MCKESAKVKVKSTEVNNGLEAWRGLNATYDSNNQGRPTSTDAVPVTAETVRDDPADDRSSRKMEMRREGVRAEVRQ